MFQPASPDDGMQPARDQLLQEIRGRAFAGPHGEERMVWVWRPANARPVLPVIYVFDGMDGLRVLLLRLKPAFDSGALPPVLFVAPDAAPRGQDRGAEYLRGFRGGRADFDAHERWFLTDVVPWAQRVLGASADREHAFVAGFSNGADLALVLAGEHPELFGGAIIHSPFGGRDAWVAPTASSQRWVVTGGTMELNGSVRRSADIPRQIIAALERTGAPVRSCIGRWEHEGAAWRDLSPGSLVWLLQLGDPTQYATPQEAAACEVANGAESARDAGP
jgi:pimeloyl-ACP methyl ester carboxylesterase